MIPSKEDILDKSLDEMGEGYFPVFTLSIHKEYVLKAMDEYAKNIAIGFFKWYFTKQNNFQYYFREVKPITTSQEIEEKIKEFEGKPIEELFNQFLKSIQDGR